MSDEGIKQIIDNFTNYEIRIQSKFFKKINFFNKKYEDLFSKSQEIDKIPFIDKYVIDSILIIYYLGSFLYLYFNFQVKYFFTTTIIGLIITIIIVFFLIFLFKKLNKFEKNVLTKFKLFFFVIITNLNIIFIFILNPIFSGNDVENQNSQKLDTSISNQNEYILRILIYNFIITNSIFAFKFEAEFILFFSISLMNSISIIISIIRININKQYFIELVINFCLTSIMYTLRRQWDINKRKIFVEKLKIEKIQKYVKNLVSINSQNNSYLLNFKQDNIFFIDKNLEILFNFEDEIIIDKLQEKNINTEIITHQKSLQYNLSDKFSNNNLKIINKNEVDIKKYNFKLDDFLSSLMYYEIPDLTGNNSNHCLSSNKINKSSTTYLFKSSNYKLSIVSNSNEKFFLASSTNNINETNKNTLQEKLKIALSNDNNTSNKRLRKDPTTDDDSKLKRTHTKFLNVSGNLNSIDFSTDNLNNVKNKTNLTCCAYSNNSNNKKSPKRLTVQNNRKILFKDLKNSKYFLDKKNEENVEENFEFIHLGIFYYVYHDTLNNKEKFDFSSQFNLLNNLSHFDSFHMEISKSNDCIQNEDNFKNIKEEKKFSSYKIINRQKSCNNNIEDEVKSLQREIILKDRKTYFNVYFRKFKLSENDQVISLNNNNNTDNTKNNNYIQEFFVEFILIDITKEIKYHKKIIKQKIKIKFLENTIDNLIKKPINNLNCIVENISSKPLGKNLSKKLDKIKFLNVYLDSAIFFNYSIDIILKSKKMNDLNINLKIQKTPIKKLINFINNFIYTILNVKNLENSSVIFLIKNELKDFDKFFLNVDEKFLLRILIFIFNNILKYNETGLINISIREIQNNENLNLELLIFFNKEENANLMKNSLDSEKNYSKIKTHKINDENAIISKNFKNIIKNDISIPLYDQNHNLSNIPSNLDRSVSNCMRTKSDKNVQDLKEKSFVNGINNQNEKAYDSFKKYFVSLYKKIILKKILKNENKTLDQIKKILKMMSINFEYSKDFIYGKETKIWLTIPLKINKELTENENNDNMVTLKREISNENYDEENISFIDNFKNSNRNSANKSEDIKDSYIKLSNNQTFNYNSESLNVKNINSNENSIISKTKTITQININKQTIDKKLSFESCDYLSSAFNGKNKIVLNWIDNDQDKINEIGKKDVNLN